MKPFGVQRVFFIGIGGIGMSALAKYYHERGVTVAGFDKTPTRVTAGLEALGISVSFVADAAEVPAAFRTKTNTLVVYTPAVPAQHPLMVFFQTGGYDMRKRALVLAEIANAGFCIAVAGTHGKTTTSSLIAHLLKSGGRQPVAFLGGIANNFNSNYVAGRGPEIVVEADEFDRSFLHLRPSIGVITATDADHLDIYGNAEAFAQAFDEFAARSTENGKCFVKRGLGLPGLSYGLDKQADNFAANIHADQGTHVFDLHLGNTVIPKVRNGLPGLHNVENAVVAAMVALACGLSPAAIKQGLETFKGVWRRFDVRVKKGHHAYIDDYAHHPEELTALLRSVRDLYPQQHITLVFQPHLFTRTRDFAVGFAAALALADQLVLLDIYPAREFPIEGISSQWLLGQVPSADKHLLKPAEVPAFLERQSTEIVVTAGAGDIDLLVAPLEELFNKQWKH
jgi:UDP-N-acetylmuramate--alanine ligase